MTEDRASRMKHDFRGDGGRVSGGDASRDQTRGRSGGGGGAVVHTRVLGVGLTTVMMRTVRGLCVWKKARA